MTLTINKLIYGVLASLVIADGFITNLLIKKGIAYEGNGLLSGIAGNNGLIIAKILGVLVALCLLIRIAKNKPKVAKYTALTFTAIYFLIVSWNLSLFA